MAQASFSFVIMVSPARYGLPVTYQALLLQTDRKHSRKLGEELSSLFVHLDPTATSSQTDVSVIVSYHLKRRREKTFLHLFVPDMFCHLVLLFFFIAAELKHIPEGVV